MTATVVNKKTDKFDVFIGRPSKWGNPYKIGIDGNRDEVIEKYRKYLLNNPNLYFHLLELDNKILGCYCKPLACHGDVIVELIEQIKNAKTI